MGLSFWIHPNNSSFTSFFFGTYQNWLVNFAAASLKCGKVNLLSRDWAPPRSFSFRRGGELRLGRRRREGNKRISRRRQALRAYACSSPKVRSPPVAVLLRPRDDSCRTSPPGKQLHDSKLRYPFDCFLDLLIMDDFAYLGWMGRGKKRRRQVEVPLQMVS